MEADWSVELAGDDATLDFPWSSPDREIRYVDIKRNPELIGRIAELATAPELRDFLIAINSASSPLETAKCDVWFTTELDPGEEIYGRCKFGSYVDIVFSSDKQRLSFPAHEQFAQQAAELLRQSPEIMASAEFVVRRCWYKSATEGFYITFYCFGFGEDEAWARRTWAMALQHSQAAILEACQSVGNRGTSA